MHKRRSAVIVIGTPRSKQIYLCCHWLISVHQIRASTHSPGHSNPPSSFLERCQARGVSSATTFTPSTHIVSSTIISAPLSWLTPLMYPLTIFPAEGAQLFWE